MSTLECRINAHVHLFILKKKSILCRLIRSCALINFRENLACVVFFTLLIFLVLSIPCGLIRSCSLIDFGQISHPVWLLDTVRLLDTLKYILANCRMRKINILCNILKTFLSFFQSQTKLLSKKWCSHEIFVENFKYWFQVLTVFYIVF